jgi:hypothetical protein
MVKKKKAEKSVFMETLLFRVCGEEPILYPPGHFGTGLTEPHSSPGPESFESIDSTTLIMEEEPHDFPPCSAYEDQPGFQDDYDDFPPHDESPQGNNDNTRIYRVYDVFLHTAVDPRASRQFYVLQDFQYGPGNEILVDHSKFVVVSLLNVLETNLD